MKIGIVGLGSIGRRHAKHLLQLGHDVIALRTNKGQLKTHSELEIQQTSNEEEFLSFHLDAIIISNPTSMHVVSALTFLRKGYKVFVEKPLGEQLEDCLKLENFQSDFVVGYCFRFSPLFKELKQRIDSLGRLYKCSFYRSYYLPLWHPYADYTKEYMGNKQLGGGAVRTLSHEIDLMHKWFGTPEKTDSIVDRLSDLDIDTEDFAWISCKYAQGFRVNFELDYLSHNYKNEGIIIGENGSVQYDYKTMEIKQFDTTGQLIYQNQFNDEIEVMYKNQMIDFMDFLKTGKSSNANYNAALLSMKTIDSVL